MSIASILFILPLVTSTNYLAI